MASGTSEREHGQPAALARLLDGEHAEPRQIATLKLTGCFAMTEAGHGSDVQRLQTTATYDPEAGDFVIVTPTDDDHKEYIGNAACHARMAAVFAQLVVAGERHGVHALVVPVRVEHGEVLEGFFQEHGRLSGPRCKAITREVNRLCDRVRGKAGGLVAAFAIPDAVLGAPIGRREARG